MTAELAVRDNVTEMARPSAGLALSFADMTMRVAQVDQFYRQVMQEGTDYGKIPGTDKPTLYQPGAQMLDQIFGYAARFEIMPASVIDWQRPIPFFHYVICCRLVSMRTGETVAEGIGSCNSFEDKYRWRNAKRVCPDCKAETIIKGQEKFGGGWICFKKVGGCGQKFRDGEAVIEDQRVGRVENEDSASLENTISKMAQKRAHVAATLNATGASRIFTQDIEDLPQFQNALVVESSSRPAPAPYDEPPTAPASHAADAETRARFEANWSKGTERATACGVTPDDKPNTDATKGALNIAQRELLEAIKAREALNATLLEKQRAATILGYDGNQIDPTTQDDMAIHEAIAAFDSIIAGTAPDDTEDAPF